jgi:hypothetical protein
MNVNASPSFRLGIMITVFVIASLALVGMFFSRPPAPNLLRSSTGPVGTVTPAGDSVNFTLNGWNYPLHYNFKCGGANHVADALASAQRSRALVRVQYRDPATQHKNLGLAYDVYAISVPGMFERSYVQCRENWIADSQRSVLMAAALCIGFLLLVLGSRLLRKR